MVSAVPAFVGALLGILGGIAIYARGVLTPKLPPVPWLLSVVIATVLAIALLNAVATLIGSRRPVADLLQSDSNSMTD